MTQHPTKATKASKTGTQSSTSKAKLYQTIPRGCRKYTSSSRIEKRCKKTAVPLTAAVNPAASTAVCYKGYMLKRYLEDDPACPLAHRDSSGVTNASPNTREYSPSGTSSNSSEDELIWGSKMSHITEILAMVDRHVGDSMDQEIQDPPPSVGALADLRINGIGHGVQRPSYNIEDIAMDSLRIDDVLAMDSLRIDDILVVDSVLIDDNTAPLEIEEEDRW